MLVISSFIGTHNAHTILQPVSSFANVDQYRYGYRN